MSGNNHLSTTSFEQLALPKALLDALTQHEFTHCTPIQDKSLPIALKNQDVIGKAQTGTGKTIAFLVACFVRLHNTDIAGDAENTQHDSAQQTRDNEQDGDEQPTSVSNNTEASTETPTENISEPQSAIDASDNTAQPEKGAEKTAGQETKEQAPVTEQATEQTPAKKPNPRKRHNTPRALMIAPTRELALQIYKDARKLNKHLKYKIGLAYGGNNYKKQQQVMEKGVDIVIGTPGRIIDFNKQGILNLKNIEVLVMDEADRMFDLGFQKDIRFLLNRLPKASERLNMLFSATISYDVEELAYEQMNQPVTVEVESEQITATKIEESVYYPATAEKLALLKLLIEEHQMKRAIIFVNTKHIGERVTETLKAMNYQAGILSGDVAQNKRERILDDFREGKIQTLVATDVAARGIHIDDIDYVINYDLPNHVEDYVHRIGRTARAGASGYAISFACEEYAMILPEIEEYIEHKLPVKSIDNEALEKIDVPKVKIERFERKPRNKKEFDKNAKGSKYQKGNDNRQTSSYSKQRSKPAEIQSVETPVNSKQTNLENRWFSRHGYELPAFG